jgi:hypothetical protein
LVFDTSGNYYIVDQGNHVIRFINKATNTISTVAGNFSAGSGGDGGQATSAQLHNPLDIALDTVGNIYISDFYNQAVRLVNITTHTISTFAGTLGVNGSSGDGNLATSAKFNRPTGMVFDNNGNLYIADQGNNVLRMVNKTTGKVKLVAGNYTLGSGGDGLAATNAQLNSPVGVTLDSNGNIYIADASNNAIRLINASTGIISTVAGNFTQNFTGDGGPATSSTLDYPFMIALDTSGDVYFSDFGNNVVRVVRKNTGNISSIAGNSTPGFSGDGGPATSAELHHPTALRFDGQGNLYIGDQANNIVRYVYSPVVP